MSKLSDAYVIGLSVVTGLWAAWACYIVAKWLVWFISDLSRIANR